MRTALHRDLTAQTAAVNTRIDNILLKGIKQTSTP